MVGEGPPLVFLDSWPSRPALGSGTAVGIDGLRSAVEALGVPVRRITPLGFRWPLPLTRLSYNLTLARRLRMRGDEVLIGFDSDGSLLPRRLADRLVVSLKGVAAEEKRFERGLPRLGLASMARLERRNCRHGRLIVVTSEHSRREAISAYGLPERRTRVVPEGIDLERWRLVDHPRRVGPLRILTVGRQYPRKDTATLIEAVRCLGGLGVEARLSVVGGGPELPRLERLAAILDVEDRVCFTGEVDFTELKSQYRDADVFCLTSRQEGFGIVLLEAMASSLPVVATRAGAIPEVVVEGETALLVPVGSARKVADAIATLAWEPDRARDLGEAGRRRVASFAWPLVAERFLSTIRRLSLTSRGSAHRMPSPPVGN